MSHLSHLNEVEARASVMTPSSPTEDDLRRNAELEFRAATEELKLRVDLYKFYIDGFIKGITIFLGLQGALFGFAVAQEPHHLLLASIGFVCCLPITLVLLTGYQQEGEFRADFVRLAARANQKVLSTNPLRMLIFATGVFWLFVMAAWGLFAVILKAK